jgi:YggT family protein
MWMQMVNMVLEVVAGLVAVTCLLRFVMQWQRISFQQPLGRFAFAVTDWLVLPLRKVVPAVSGWDMSSLLAAWLVKLTQFGVLWFLAGGRGQLGLLPLVGLVGLAQLVVSALGALVLVLALMSWVNPGSPMHALSERLCSPFLRPFRRWIPLIGGVDLSPIALLLVLQLLGIVLAQLQMSWMY